MPSTTITLGTTPTLLCDAGPSSIDVLIEPVDGVAYVALDDAHVSGSTGRPVSVGGADLRTVPAHRRLYAVAATSGRKVRVTTGPRGTLAQPDLTDAGLRVTGSSGPFAFNLPAPPALSGTPGTAYTPKTRNTQGRPMFLAMPCAVISEPGQNGHISLQLATIQPTPNELVAPPDNWFLSIGTIACRNNADPTGDPGEEVAAGGQLSAIVPDGWWWRLKFEQIAGWGAPSFVYLSAATFLLL